VTKFFEALTSKAQNELVRDHVIELVTAVVRVVPYPDRLDDSFSATIRCHDANGELYNVTFSRDRVTVQSYSDNAILAKVETWADTVPALA